MASFSLTRISIAVAYVPLLLHCHTHLSISSDLVDRDFGPKAGMEDAMIDFLDSYIYVTEPNAGLVDAVDADQWLKNLASYAVLVNMDSPLNNLNNWFVPPFTLIDLEASFRSKHLPPFATAAVVEKKMDTR